MQKYFSRKGKDLQKYFSRKGRDLQKYLSIQVFRRSIQIVSVVFKGIKKTCKFIISLYLEQNCNDISGDLNTCGLHCPSTTELRAREGEELRPAKQGWVVCVSAALRPSFCWSLTAPESRGRPHILGNKYEHLVR